MDRPKALAQLLKRWRRDSRLTLRELEKQAGVSNSYLSQLENGKTDNLSFFMLLRILEIYKIPPEQFMKLFYEEKECKHEYACKYCGLTPNKTGGG